MEKRSIASAKPGSRIVRIGRKYIIAGSKWIWVEGKEVFIYSEIVVRRIKYFDMMRSLVRKHYRTAMVYNKKHINRTFIYAGLPVPAYKDSQVTEIVLFIKSMSDKTSCEIAQAVIKKFNLCSK